LPRKSDVVEMDLDNSPWILFSKNQGKNLISECNTRGSAPVFTLGGGGGQIETVLSETRLPTRSLALGILFGALFAVLKVISLFPVIGSPGRFFSAADVVAPVFGIILEPVVAGLAVTVGTCLAVGATGTTLFYGLDFVPALLDVIAVGLMIRGRRRLVVAMYAGLIALFSIHPNAQDFEVIRVSALGGSLWVPFTWLHIVCFMLILSPLGGKAVNWTLESSSLRATVGVALLCLVGTTMQHLAGSFLFLSVLGLPRSSLTRLFQAAFVAYPVERLTIATLATALGSVALRPLKNSGLLPKEFRSITRSRRNNDEEDHRDASQLPGGTQLPRRQKLDLNT